VQASPVDGDLLEGAVRACDPGHLWVLRLDPRRLRAGEADLALADRGEASQGKLGSEVTQRDDNAWADYAVHITAT